MGKFDGILIATDLDGTLVSEGKVSRENADAIRYFQSEGMVKLTRGTVEIVDATALEQLGE